MMPVRASLVGVPVLETERLILRGPEPGDWPAFRDFRASARTAYTGGTKPEHQAAEQFASFFGHWVLRGFGRLIAVERATGVALGHFGPMQWQDAAQVELTWSLWHAAAEGKGYAVEAALAMRDWVFGVAGVASARAEVHRNNAASHAIARRLGGVVDPDQRPVWMDVGDVYLFAGGAA